MLRLVRLFLERPHLLVVMPTIEDILAVVRFDHICLIDEFCHVLFFSDPANRKKGAIGFISLFGLMLLSTLFGTMHTVASFRYSGLINFHFWFYIYY